MPTRVESANSRVGLQLFDSSLDVSKPEFSLVAYISSAPSTVATRFIHVLLHCTPSALLRVHSLEVLNLDNRSNYSSRLCDLKDGWYTWL